MDVNPKQSQTGVMCVARLRCVALPGAKVESTISTAMAQASWKVWKLTGSIFRLPAGATLRQRPHWLHCSMCRCSCSGSFLSTTMASKRTGGDDLLQQVLIRAFFREPVRVVVHGVVHVAACLARHAAQRQVLERRAEPAAGMSLHVGEVDQEAGILDHAGDLPLLDALIRALMFVEILLIRSRRGIDGAADHSPWRSRASRPLPYPSSHPPRRVSRRHP